MTTDTLPPAWAMEKAQVILGDAAAFWHPEPETGNKITLIGQVAHALAEERRAAIEEAAQAISTIILHSHNFSRDEVVMFERALTYASRICLALLDQPPTQIKGETYEIREDSDGQTHRFPRR